MGNPALVIDDESFMVATIARNMISNLRDDIGRTASFDDAAYRSDVSVPVRGADSPARLLVRDVYGKAGAGVAGIVPHRVIRRIGWETELCGCANGLGQDGHRIHDRGLRQKNAAMVS